MESVTRNVRDLPCDDRSALERVVGHPLGETQQVIVNVVDVDPIPATLSTPADVPAWWKIYDGLSDAEIDTLDQAIRQRANLTREFE